MTRSTMSLLAPLVSAAGLLAGCASTPYSQLDGRGYYSRADLHAYPVLVVAVDGRSEVRSPVPIEPGLHRVTVQGPPAGARRWGEERTVTLEVRPCTRYHLVAVKDTRLAREFSVRIDYEEGLAGCRPPA